MTSERTEHKEEPDSVRFVVLEHTGREGLHFDLMIETGGQLATWKSRQPPEEAVGRALSCARIADHRMAYLDYEGPVSGDRGHVRRRDTGACTIEHRTPNSWHIRFEGQRLVGRFVLSRSGDEEEAWRLRALAL